MTQFRSKKEIKAALKAARKKLSAANSSNDRLKIQHYLKVCQDLQDVLGSWKGK
jgi:hypothetical protein